MTVDQLLRCLADSPWSCSWTAIACVTGHRGSMTPDLRGEISAQRSAIIDHLRAAAATDAVGTRCTICDRRDWVDAPPKDGRIRTVCGKCGRFIGYRPVESPRA